jgi:hypothetical protein
VARTVVVELRWDLAKAAAKAARETGLPIGLSLKIAVEASRIRDELAELGQLDVSAVVSLLDEAAMAALVDHRRRGTRCLRGGLLEQYAAALLDAPNAPTPVTTPARIEMALSEREYAAWLVDAQRAGIALGTFVAAAVSTRPRQAVEWEAAAALAARTIGEWALQVLLKRAAG